MSNPNQRLKALVALVLLVPVPSLGTWTAMVAMPGPFGRTVFMLSKAWTFLLPVLWLVWVDKCRPSIPRPRRAGSIFASQRRRALFS